MTKQRTLAGILAILFGTIGIHKFYLGYVFEGVIMLCFSLVFVPILSLITCGMASFLWMLMPALGLAEGIIYLSKSDEDFYQCYELGRKTWF